MLGWAHGLNPRNLGETSLRSRIREQPESLELVSSKLDHTIELMEQKISENFFEVTPAGVEPAIFWMRTKCPRPLDDGAKQPDILASLVIIYLISYLSEAM